MLVAGLTGSAGYAGQVLDRPVGLARFIDAELAEPVVDRSELVFSPEDDPIQLADDIAGAVKGAMVGQWGEEEPHQGQVEGEREGQDFLGVELSAPLALVGPFDGRDAGLGKALAKEGLKGLCGLFLGPPPQLSGQAEVVSNDLV